jgi:LacI family transcriptional regulator, galactose operon repressor
VSKRPTSASNNGRRPTIADIARLCGVTAATVSRVLNNTENFSTSAEMRQKIRETAQKLGYVPDLGARNLSLRNSRVIGLFASPHTHIGEGINEALIEGITETLHGNGYDVFYGLTRRRRTKNPVPFWRFDGAVLMQAPRPEIIAELDTRRVPYVCVNERLGHPAASVMADDVSGMKAIVSHLTDLSHETIAYANAPSNYFTHYSVEERHNTLVEMAKAQNLKLVEGHENPFHAHTPATFVRKMVIEGGATAVIAYDHQIAFMLLGAANGMGLRIPQDFSLICFNDVFPMSIIYPPLTTVLVPGREMGRLAAEMLLSDLASPKPLTSREIRVPEYLIIRSSTDSPFGISRPQAGPASAGRR